MHGRRLDGDTNVFEFLEHALSCLPTLAWAMHRIIDDEIFDAEFVDDGGIAFAPVLGEVLGDYCFVFFLDGC